MTDNAHDGRMADYLDDLDTAADWQPEGAGWDGFPLSYDEWIALRLLAGLAAGTFTEYLAAIGEAAAPVDEYVEAWRKDAPLCPRCGTRVYVAFDGAMSCWRCLTYWPNRAALDAATCEVEE